MKLLQPLSSNKSLQGQIQVPPDKSIAQRAAIFTGIANGVSTIKNFPEAGDPLSTLKAMQQLGVKVEKQTSNKNGLTITGRGFEGLIEPKDIIDCGNSGTCMRLLMGVLAGNPSEHYVVLNGDESLRGRPMKRIVEPLKLLGAEIYGREGANKAPLNIIGRSLKSSNQTIKMKVASAQLKSALLLAGLNAQDSLTLEEPAFSRNHSEIMFKSMGANISTNNRTIKLTPSKLQAQEIVIPGDVSSAAFICVAATLVKGSEVLIQNVGLNETRSGYLQVLKQMGAQIESKTTNSDVEPFGEIFIKASELKGIEIGGEIIPNIIDEIPILALAASLAKGQTIIKDAHELRVKESDRLEAMYKLLKSLGVKLEQTPDGLIIEGRNGELFEPIENVLKAGHDHRIAMTATIASLLSTKELQLEGAEWANISFPGFYELLESLKT